jgi:Domain of unknown function (DUF4516)
MKRTRLGNAVGVGVSLLAKTKKNHFDFLDLDLLIMQAIQVPKKIHGVVLFSWVIGSMFAGSVFVHRLYAPDMHVPAYEDYFEDDDDESAPSAENTESEENGEAQH